MADEQMVFRAARGYLDTGDDLAPGCTCGQHKLERRGPDEGTVDPRPVLEGGRRGGAGHTSAPAPPDSPRINYVQREHNNRTVADYEYAKQPPPDPYKDSIDDLRRRNDRKEYRR